MRFRCAGDGLAAEERRGVFAYMLLVFETSRPCDMFWVSSGSCSYPRLELVDLAKIH